MSGLAGIVERGYPVPPRDRLTTELGVMLATLALRGPDGVSIEALGRAGFGLTLLDLNEGGTCLWIGDTRCARTRPGAGGRARPEAVGQTRTVGDAAAGALPDEGASGTVVAADVTWLAGDGGPGTARTVLEDALARSDGDLLAACRIPRGDFAIAVWHAESEELQLARDPLGARPLFYSQSPDRIVFASDPRAIRAVTGESEIDRASAAEMLLLGAVRDPAASIYRRIRRVPPGHVVTFAPDGVSAAPFWQLATAPGLGHEAYADPPATLREIAATAVADRAGHRPVAARASGGLDSSFVVSLADSALAGRAVASPRVHAVAVESDAWETGGWAERMDKGGIEVERLSARMGGGDDAFPARPQPVFESWPGLHARSVVRAARFSRRIITGHGGDLISSPEPMRFLHLLSTGAWTQLGREIASARRISGQWPPLHLRSWLRWNLNGSPGPRVPPWIAASAARELTLEDRLLEVAGSPPPARLATGRPHFVHYASAAYWQSVAELEDPGSVGVGAVALHPLLDTRLLVFARDLPPVPWCVRKTVIRLAARGLVPEDLRLRPKTTPPVSAITAPPDPGEQHLLRDPWAVEAGIVDPGALALLAERYWSGEQTYATRAGVGHVLALERWLRASGLRA